MAEPYTIRIFVPDGDPDGVRIIDRMNWTGVGLVFPREKWATTRNRPESARTGVYILLGYQGDDELPTLYIGQGDGIRDRIDSHFKTKDFWDRGILFTSTSGGLNRAHITWLEYALIAKATEAKRSKLDNGNVPQEPALSESEKADTRAFLKEIFQILPLVGVHVFEKPQAIASPKVSQSSTSSAGSELDTLIVPAHEDGFNETFLGEDCWYAIRIGGGMISKIKYIAAYVTDPVRKITHYAPVHHIEPYGEEGKYKVVFSSKAVPMGPVVYGDAPQGSMQGIRYTNLEVLKRAKKLTDLQK